MRALLLTASFVLSEAALSAPDNTTPLAARDKEPTVVLTFRTINHGQKVAFSRIPQNPLAAPFWLQSLDKKSVSYQTQLELWTPQTAPEDASGGLHNLAGKAPLEWALQITPAPSWPDLPPEPNTPAQEAPDEVEDNAKAADAGASTRPDTGADAAQNAGITVPETLPAQVYFGCGDMAPAEQPQNARIATAVLERWRTFGRLPIDWGGAGTLGQTQNTWSATELAASNTVPRAPGEYRLITSFAPDLKFNIGTEQQFMPPVRLSLGPLPPDWSKPLQLYWLPVEGARGYRVRAVGQRFKSTDPRAALIMWSATPLARLQSEVPIMDDEETLKRGELLPPETTGCLIPAGIFMDNSEITFILEAIGQARTFAAPQAPKDAPPGTFGGTTLRVVTVSQAFVTLETGQVVE